MKVTPMPLYCTRNHENPLGSKFCHLCGELLPTPSPSPPSDPNILGLHYRLIQELGQGGFGRTYLAEDIHRFNERCVLKEFAPQVQGAYAIQKAQELFEREAGTLYKLQHPQIPQFRELFTVPGAGTARLFLVQDYVEGQTFHALLEARKRQGQTFSSTEVTQLLQQVLPVLQYIHSRGVVHRDISPDNLMLRQADGLPVLIDFGGVKQVAAAVESQFTQPAETGSPVATRLGKVGYAPLEQMQTGAVQPSSDLYALGMTALVFLTGREPQELVNGRVPLSHWFQTAGVDPRLATILTRMLAAQPRDRYPSAQSVLQDLGLPPAPATTYPPTQAPLSQVPVTVAPTQATYAVNPSPAHPSTQPPAPPIRQSSHLGKLAAMAGVVILVGLGSWWGARQWLASSRPPSPLPTLATPTSPVASPSPTAQLPPEEQARKDALGERRRKLGIDFNFFVRLINQQFYQAHPELKGRQLGAGPEDAKLRADWDRIASQTLNLIGNLSPEALGRLGQYGQAERDRWSKQVNQVNLSSRAFYDLVDAKFFSRFPEQRDQQFINQPIGQVWHAIASDQVATLTSGNALTRLQFAPGRTDQQVVGKLQPGEGRAFIINLKQEQVAELTLQADPKVLLSFYAPTSKLPPFLEDSTETTWSGKLPESGYYEIVVVSTAEEAVTFELNVSAAGASELANPEPSPNSDANSP